MPFLPRTVDGGPTPTYHVFVESSSEAAALPGGQKALTPIIAGTISGTCIGVAWLVALIAALVKRHKRKRLYKKVGRPDLVNEHPKPEVFIVPPDPAVVQGQRKPGERVFIDEKEQKQKERKDSNGDAGNEGRSNCKGKGKAKDQVTERRRHGGDGKDVGEEDGDASRTDVNDALMGRQVTGRPRYFSRLSTIVSLAGSRRPSHDGPQSPESPMSPNTSGVPELPRGGATENQFQPRSGGGGWRVADADAEEDEKDEENVRTEDFAYEPHGQDVGEAADTESRNHVHLYPPPRRW